MSKTQAAPKIKKDDVVRWRGENFVVLGTIVPIVPDPRIAGHKLAQLQSIDQLHFATVATQDLEVSDMTGAECSALIKLRDERAVIERPQHDRRVARKSLRHQEAKLEKAVADGDKLKVAALRDRVRIATEALKTAGGAA